MVSAREKQQVDSANASGRTPAVFIHGLWLLAGSWQPWMDLFDQAGYAPVAVDWPDDPETVEQARANPEAFAGKGVGQVADHVSEVIAQLSGKPVVIGHSFGGLLSQIAAGRGLSAATVAIDPAPFRGVLPLPISALRAAMPVLANPLNRSRAVSLTFAQFRYGWANALSDKEARELHETLHVPGPGRAPVPGGVREPRPVDPGEDRHPQPRSRAAPDHLRGRRPHRSHRDVQSLVQKQQRNSSPTEFTEVPNRGHSLTIDSGWREVADHALEFVRRFAAPA